MKLIEVVADKRHIEDIKRLAKVCQVTDVRFGQADLDDRVPMRLLVSGDRLQKVLDLLQDYFGEQENVRIIVLPVDSILPKLKEDERKESLSASASREALYNQIFRGAACDVNYIALVVLSTIVAVLGLLEDNVAVVIGAMVIAPLLGPNLAVAYGSTIGDIKLIKEGLFTGLVGVTSAFILSVAIGLFWQGAFVGPELSLRSEVGLSAVALAMASGAAATLSLTSGVSSVLVGVMVAVALLPPTAAMGLFASQTMWQQMQGAALLLGVNLVSVILSAKIVFTLKGVVRRDTTDKNAARLARVFSFLIWSIALLILVLAVLSR